MRTVPAEETSTLDDVVACLQRLDDDDGQELGQPAAGHRRDAAGHAVLRLAAGRHCSATDAALTVITMAGLRLPDLKIEREYWSAEEQLALPMLHTAHRLAVRRCYGGSMASRKLVGLDEAHFMEGWRSGRSFLVRLARDSRKWNLAALVASQNPKDILGLDVQNLVSTVFVGRIAEDAEIASEALRLLRVPVDDGYEADPRLALPGRRRARPPGWASASSSCATSTAGCRRSGSTCRTSTGLLDHLDTTPAGGRRSRPERCRPSLADLEA